MPPKKKVSESVPPPQEDVSMVDAGEEQVEEDSLSTEDHRDNNNPATPPESEHRIKILPGSTDDAASFQFENEDHTLGNALRWIIMKNPDVEFCGYSIPHPSEALMNVRIQTYKGTALEALDKGLADLMDLSGIVADEFIRARADFAGSHPSR